MLDKNDIKHLVKKLVNFGLSERDARVYIVLLDFGVAVGSSKIISRTGLHGQYVYQSLAALEDRGLTKHAIVRGRKKFSANQPERLQFMVEEKRVLADQLVEELQVVTKKTPGREFEVFEGDTALIQHEFDMLERAEYGEAMEIIGATGDRFFSLLGRGQQERYDSLRVEKQIEVRFIGGEEQREYLEKIRKSYEKFQFRILPEYPNGIVNTIVRPENVTIYLYTELVLAYAVYSREVADNYRAFFGALWSRCEV